MHTADIAKTKFVIKLLFTISFGIEPYIHIIVQLRVDNKKRKIKRNIYLGIYKTR